MPAPAPPEVVDAAMAAVAQGASTREAGRIAGVSKAVVSIWMRRLEDQLDGWRTRLRARWTRNVLGDVDAIARAQAAAASNPECRHGPQAARVLLEGAGIIGGHNLHLGDINMGDVNVTVDARSVSISSDPVALAAELAERRRALGL